MASAGHFSPPQAEVRVQDPEEYHTTTAQITDIDFSPSNMTLDEVMQKIQYGQENQDQELELLLNDANALDFSDLDATSITTDSKISAFPSPLATHPVYTSKLTYNGALALGDPFLAVPKPILDRILALYISHYPHLLNIEVPEARDLTFPPLFDLNDTYYLHCCKAILERATWTLISDAAIMSLCVFLNEFSERDGNEAVRSMEFTDLAMFEKGMFKSNGTYLLERCKETRHVSLIINLDDLIFTDPQGAKELDVNAMVEKYDLEAIARLPRLETVTLRLRPFMALKKKLTIMEEERISVCNNGSGAVIVGVEGFWGLQDWLELQALDQMRCIDVKCPTLAELCCSSGGT